MKHIIPFKLANGGQIFVEIVNGEEKYVENKTGPQPISRVGGITNKVVRSFEETLEPVKFVADSILLQLRRLNEIPHEVEVEFGLKIGMNADLVVAAGNIEANYKVSLRWKQDQLKGIATEP